DDPGARERNEPGPRCRSRGSESGGREALAAWQAMTAEPRRILLQSQGDRQMPPSPRPLRLTDQQLDCVHRAAWPLAPADRSAFLEAVAAKLSERPELLGDGHVARVVIECQRAFWTPPELDESETSRA